MANVLKPQASSLFITRHTAHEALVAFIAIVDPPDAEAHKPRPDEDRPQAGMLRKQSHASESLVLPSLGWQAVTRVDPLTFPYWTVRGREPLVHR